MKKFFVFIFVMFGMAVVSSAAHAADCTPTSTAFADGVAYREYSSQIEMTDGNDGYTFEYYSGAMPAGLTLSSNGVLSGTPTSSKNYKALRIKITHTDGSSAIVKFSVRIAPREVNAYVTVNGVSDKNAHFTYASDAVYTIAVTFTDSESGDTVDVTSYKYSVNSTYYTSSETTTISGLNNCGWYGIEVYNPDGCTVANQNGVNNIVIDQCPVTVTVEDLTVTYGEDYEMAVTFDVEYDVPYTIEYRASGGEYTETKPTDAGTYTVRVTVDSSNYSSEIAYATLTIEES